MARLGFALWLQETGLPLEAAAEAAFSRDPDVIRILAEAFS